MSCRLGFCFVVSLFLSSLHCFVADAKSAEFDSHSVGEVFRDCDDCPSMVAVSLGSFTMGSPHSEQSRDEDEGPLHGVRIAKFAVGRFESHLCGMGCMRR